MRIFMAFLSLLFYTTIHAQQVTDSTTKRFGIIVGANVTNMNFNKGIPAPLITAANAWKPGIVIGLLLRVPLSKKLMLQPEYYFTQRQGEDKALSISYAFDYLSLPILLRYTVSPRFALLAGPHADLLIRAKVSASGASRSITKDVEERSIGALIGLETVIYKSFILNARYLQGFNHIGIGQRSTAKEFKYEGVQVTMGFLF